jgi:hypothetical protein
MPSCIIQGVEVMSHEINQLDISGIQLRESKTQPKVSLSREIGEARIVHTIFGRAKVRIIRKDDKYRRAMWWTGIFVTAAISAVIWQEWYATEQTQPVQSDEPVLSGKPAANEAAPESRFESIAAPAIPPAVVIEPNVVSPADNSKQAIVQKSMQQPRAVINPAVKEDVKPPVARPKPVVIPPRPVAVQPKPAAEKPSGVTQPVAAEKLQTPPVAASGNVLKTPTVPQKLPVSAVAVTPATVKPAVPASSATAAPVLSAPLVKEDAASQAPVADKQLAAPINAPKN